MACSPNKLIFLSNIPDFGIFKSRILKIILLFIFMIVDSEVTAYTDPDSLKSLIQLKSVPDSLRIQAAIDLSREIHRSDPDDDDDFFYADLAVELAEAYADTLLFAQALDNLGLLNRYHQQYIKSIQLHVKALELIKDRDVLPYYKMRFANNIGTAARYDDAYDIAVKYFLYALKIAEAEEDLRNIAISSNGLGNALSYLEGREDEALAYFQKALQAEKTRDNSLGMAINYLSISSYYTRKEMHFEARKYLDLLLEINEERKDVHGMAMTFESFGHSFLKEGKNLVQAEKYYRNALPLFEQFNNQLKISSIYASLGEVCLMQNRTGEAFQWFEKSLDLAEAINNKSLIMESAERLSSLYESLPNYRKALEYYKISRAYKDSIDLSEQETVIAGLKMEYDFEKKESEIALLKIDQSLKEAELLAQQERFRNEKFVLFSGIFGISVLALVLILILRNLSLKKSNKLQIQHQEKERLETEYEMNLLQAEILASRMQINPHFLFNCLVSTKYLIQKNETESAIRYLTTLSRFIRSILETGQLKTIKLPDELDLVQKFAELEENRFDHEFKYTLELCDITRSELENIFIPPLLLQPFVENAIWHGLIPSNRPTKELGLKIQRSNGGILISITDNGVGRTKKEDADEEFGRRSMGLRITQDRIDLYNKTEKTKLGFEIVDNQDESGNALGTTVHIHLEPVKLHAKSQRKQPVIG